jgi:hypothetical protein
MHLRSVLFFFLGAAVLAALVSLGVWGWGKWSERTKIDRAVTEVVAQEAQEAQEEPEAAVTEAAPVAAATPAAVEEDRFFLLRDGRAQAVIVIPDDAGVMNRYAAEELAVHLEKAGGERLPIVAESELSSAPALPHRIFLGPTQAARAAGFAVDELGEEEAVVEVKGDDLFMVARREKKWPKEQWIESRRSSGELFAVYDFLDRRLGVRWMWPGELGTYVPSRGTVGLPGDFAADVRPAFAVRRIRWPDVRDYAFRGAYPPEAERFWFSREGMVNYGTALRDFMRRHRDTGGTGMPRLSHDMAKLWETHGKEHPEWFVLNSVGEHGHEPDASSFARRHVNVRVSSAGLRDYLVNEHWDGSDHLSLGQADARQMCYHPESIAMYGPQPDLSTVPEAVRGYYQPYFMSNVYADFWKDIQSRMAERNPNATVTTHLYHWYFPAPTSGIKLNDRIVGTFCPWFDERIDRFPLEDDVYEWIKAQWRGWQETGIRLIFRPNHLHKGNYMPYLSMRQTGDMLHFVGNHGATGFDHGRLTGQWAVHGPETYLHFRYLTRPDLSVEEILDEYYEGFGPAGEAVREYFDYWENYTLSLIRAGNFNRLRRTGDRAERGHGELLDTHLVFPPEAFVPARAILDKAAAAAATSDDPDYVRRVKFLELGLEHALKVVALSTAFDGEHTLPEGSPRAAQAAEVLRELIAFRKDHEDWFFSDYIYLSGDLKGPSWSWNVRPLLALIDQGVSAGTVIRPLPKGGWRWREDPDGQGESAGWQNPETSAGDWERVELAESGKSPGDGSGTVWYRLDWRAGRDDPAEGKVSVQLKEMGGAARVWLNGELVGTRETEAAASGQPLTLDVTTSYRRGGVNNLVVEVTRESKGDGLRAPVNLLFAKPAEELDLDPNF